MTRLPLIRPLAVRVCGAWGGALGRRMSCAYTAKTDKRGEEVRVRRNVLLRPRPRCAQARILKRRTGLALRHSREHNNTLASIRVASRMHPSVARTHPSAAAHIRLSIPHIGSSHAVANAAAAALLRRRLLVGAVASRRRSPRSLAAPLTTPRRLVACSRIAALARVLRRLAPRCRLPAHSHSALASRQSPWLLHGRLAETTLAASWNASIARYSRLSARGGGVSGQKPGGWRGLKVPQRDQSYGSEAEPLQEVMEAALAVCETWLL